MSYYGWDEDDQIIDTREDESEPNAEGWLADGTWGCFKDQMFPSRAEADQMIELEAK